MDTLQIFTKNFLPRGFDAAATGSPGMAWVSLVSGTNGLGYIGSRGWGDLTGAEAGAVTELKSVVVAVVRVRVTGVDREWCRTAGAELLRSCLEAGVGVLAIIASALLVDVGTLDIDTRRRTRSNVCRGAEIVEKENVYILQMISFYMNGQWNLNNTCNVYSTYLKLNNSMPFMI